MNNNQYITYKLKNTFTNLKIRLQTEKYFYIQQVLYTVLSKLLCPLC